MVPTIRRNYHEPQQDIYLFFYLFFVFVRIEMPVAQLSAVRGKCLLFTAGTAASQWSACRPQLTAN